MPASHLQPTNLQYYPQALLQMILLKQRLKQREELSAEVEALRQVVYARQSKHRRCDRQIHKSFQCANCQKVYASDVALKLHQKLKHLHEQNVKTVKEKSDSVQGQETEHLSESVMGNSRLLVEQS